MNFTFLNIPVGIHPSFWIFLLFFTGIYNNPSIESVIVGAVMFVSLLVHEYGHALTAAYFGAKPTITLEAFGGRAEYSSFGISRKKQLLITLNGPLMESLLIAFPYFLLESGIFASHYYIQYILYIFMRLNILWCLLNLIPIKPLDGGNIVSSLLEDRFGARGSQISLAIGLISVVLIAPYLYFGLGITFFPIFLAILGLQNIQQLRQNWVRNEVSPFSLYRQGVEAAASNDFKEAKKHFKKLLKAKDNYIKHSAIESLAKIYFQENDRQKSYDLLLNTDHSFLREGKSLLCKLAFERNNHQLVGKYSREIYHLEPSYETAILNSQAFANLNQPRLAGGWLATASQFGIEYDDKAKEVLKQATYNSVRDDPAFNEAFKADYK